MYAFKFLKLRRLFNVLLALFAVCCPLQCQCYTFHFFIYWIADKKKLELAEKFKKLKSSGKLQQYLKKKGKKNTSKERKKMPHRRVMEAWGRTRELWEKNQLAIPILTNNGRMWTRSPRSECEKIRGTCEWTDLVFHSTTWRDSIFFQEVIGKRLPAVWLMENNFFRYFLWCILLNLSKVVWTVISYRRRVHGNKWTGGGPSFFGVWRTFAQWEVAVVKAS